MSKYHRFESLKILAYADRLRKVAAGERPYPLDWHIYPSNVCNHSCTWCLEAGTQIATPIGTVAIEALKPGHSVYGPSGRVNTITETSCRPVIELWELQSSGHTLRCSAEHPILTATGWLPACKCQVGQQVVVRTEPRCTESAGGYSGLLIAGIRLEHGLTLQSLTSVRCSDERPVTVYNFSCTPDEAYEANGFAVHNCMFRQNGEQENFPVKLPADLLIRAVEDARRTGGVLTHFSGGGEPLLNPHTLPAMRHAIDLGLKVALSTNGSRLTPEVAASVDYIRVSLNAGTAAQHTHTNHEGQGKGDFDTILANLRRCVPHKRQDIGLAFALDHENYRDVLPFCRLAADVGVDFVHIRPAFYYDAAKDAAVRAIMPTALEECESAKQLYGDKVQIFALSDKFDHYWTPRTYSACNAVWTGVCLRATGDFAVCQDRTDLTFGAAWKDGVPFETVWNSEEHQRVVASIHAGGELDRCPRCVWGHRNVILSEIFGPKDAMRLALI